MNIYHRIGPNTGVSYGLGGGLFFTFLVLLGAIPFIAIWIIVYAFFAAIALVLGIVLAVVGIGWKICTGRDAAIPVPGSAHGTAIEYWMEGKGWIRLPKRLHPTHTLNT